MALTRIRRTTFLLALAAGSAYAQQPSVAGDEAAAAPSVQPPASVHDVRVLGRSNGHDVELEISGSPQWTSWVDDENRVVVTLTDTVAAPRAFQVSGALVTDVEIAPEIVKKKPVANVLITPAGGAIGHSIHVAPETFSIRFRHLDPSSGKPSVDPEKVLEEVGLHAPPGLDLSPQLDDYRIGSGDLLKFDVFGIVELQRTARVQADGRVALPVLGRFSISGLTLEEAERQVATMLQRQGLATNPDVFISVEEYRSRGVYVQGAVRAPGIYQVPGGKPLLELLSEAGGLTERNPIGQRILILRPNASGAQDKIEISAEKLLTQGDISLNIPVLPGDMVMVPEPVKFEIFVTGAVSRPGPIDARGGMTVLQAITAAGGPTPRAKLGNVQVIRRAEDGTQTTLEVDVKAVRKGRAEDVPLEANDTVVVSEWFF